MRYDICMMYIYMLWLRYVTLRYVTLCYTMVPYIALHYIAIAIALHEQINIINHIIRFNSMVCFTHSKTTCFRPLPMSSVPGVHGRHDPVFADRGGRRLGWHVAALAGDPAVDLGDFVRPWAADSGIRNIKKPGTCGKIGVGLLLL